MKHKGTLFLFLFSPFISFIYSFFSVKRKESQMCIGLFFLLFGYCVTFNLTGNIELDGWYHATMYEESTIELLINNIKSSYLLGLPTNQWSFDIFINIVALVAKTLGGSYHLFFLLVGAFYSVFFLKSLSILLDYSKIQNRMVIFCLMFWFFMTFSIFSITGVRFACAFWFSVWCTLKLYIEGDKKYLWISILATQIHLSFWVYFFILLFSYFTGRYVRIWSIIAVVSMLITFIPFDFIASVADYLPEAFSGKALAYGEDRSDLISEGLQESNFKKYFVVFEKFIYIYLIFYLIKFKDYIIERRESGILLLILIIFSVCNILTFIPDFQRFKAVLNPLIICAISLVPRTKSLQWLIYLIPLSLVLSFYENILWWKEVLPSRFFYSNIIHILFYVQ